jgi:GNAT superfamily N-acetyltransferase
MAIRPLEDADLEGVLDLWELWMAAGAAVDRRWVPSPGGREVMRGWARGWTQLDPFPHGLVAEEDGEIIGYIAGMPVGPMPVLLAPPTARVTDLFVVEAHRRTSVGTELATTFLQLASEAGYPGAVASVLFLDEGAGTFWTQLGFLPEQVLLRKK